MNKRCNVCKTVLTIENKVHWRQLCKECRKKENKAYMDDYKQDPEWIKHHRATSRAHYHTHKSQRKNTILLREYGLSLDSYNELVKMQDGKCAICGLPERALNRGLPKALAVDHCHRTGKVRALLCHACNTGIGSFGDNPELLDKATIYLRQHAP